MFVMILSVSGMTGVYLFIKFVWALACISKIERGFRDRGFCHDKEEI